MDLVFFFWCPTIVGTCTCWKDILHKVKSLSLWDYWWILFFPMKKINSMLFDFIHLLKLFLLLNMNVKIIFFVNLIWVWSPLALIARKTAALFFYGSCFISPWNAGFLTWRPGVLWLFTLMFWKYCTLKVCKVVDHQLWIYTSYADKRDVIFKGNAHMVGTVPFGCRSIFYSELFLFLFFWWCVLCSNYIHISIYNFYSNM